MPLNLFGLDTLKTELRTIEVIGEKQSPGTYLIGNNPRVFIIPESRAINQLQDIVNFSSGVQVKDYGGMGGLKTISVRGSHSNQVVIAIDGIPLNNASNASIDMTNIPLDLIQSVEVLSSGLSAKFGSNSIGGVINLLTSKNDSKEKLIVKSSLGSFGLNSYGISVPLNFIGLPIKIVSNFTHYDGDYNFKYNNFGKISDTNRTNNSFQSFNLSSNFKKVFSNSYLTISELFQVSRKGLPGAVLIGKLEDRESSFKELSFKLLSGYTTNTADNKLLISLKNLLNYSKSELDNFQELIRTNSKYKYNSFQTKFISEFSYKYTLFNINMINEIGYEQLKGYFLQPELNNQIDRFQASISLGISDDINIGHSNLSYTISGRIDEYSKINQTPLSYLVGAEWRDILRNLDLRINNSRNFRVPSFNEMYYLNYGNVNLKPEVANSTEFGLEYTPVTYVEVSASIFYNLVKDKIVSIPKNPLMWTAENFGLVEIKGVNVSFRVKPVKDRIEFNFDYTFQSPKDISEKSINYGKILPYTSEEKLTASFKTKFRNFIFITDFYYNSFVYTLPDNSINSILPAFYDLNCEIGYNFQYKMSEISLSFQMKNILNRSNYSIINYPLPGRNFIINLIYKLK